MLTRAKKKATRVWDKSSLKPQLRKKYLIFHGREKYYIRNGAWLLEESISLFHGKANPIRHFSADDLNNMKVDRLPFYRQGFYNLHLGSWEGMVVVIKKPHVADHDMKEHFLRDIVVATQMDTHNNAQKILGCCLETDHPVLVNEWVAYGDLRDSMPARDGNDQNEQILEWKDRLRIAWEISHAVAYLHTAFPRVIIHRNLTPASVFLDHDNSAKLTDYCVSVSIPEGEEFVETMHIAGTYGYMAPEYAMHSIVTESTDVYSFGMLFLMLVTGKNPVHFIQGGGQLYEQRDELVTWVQNGIRNMLNINIQDYAITRNALATIEDLQLRASTELAIRCIAAEGECRPTMVEVATQLKNMIRPPQGECIYRIFQGSKENFIDNEAIVLEESISIFGHRVNPARYFSVYELNNMNVEYWHKCCNLYQGSWEGRAVFVKLPENVLKVPTSSNEIRSRVSREIVIATEMTSHNNFHKLLGCCLETKFPVLVYEWMQTLEDRILLQDENQNKVPLLEWKDRLRIAWEISNVVSFLPSFIQCQIIDEYLELDGVFLDLDNTAKLSNFNFCVSNLESEEYRMEKCTDVYSFGVLLLVLLTGKTTNSSSVGVGESSKSIDIIDWVTKETMKDHTKEILDPVITRGVTDIEYHQMRACLQLALLCTAREVYMRPTMLEIESELENLITSPESIPTTSDIQGERVHKIFQGRQDNFIENEDMVLEESISLFHGRLDPIRYFSIDELNSMKFCSNNVEIWQKHYAWYQGSWEGRAVLAKLSNGVFMDQVEANKFLQHLSREILVATQMATHNNVHKLLGCCLETKFPVIVYEWMAAETLEDRILLKDENQKKLPLLEWKDRLRIAWEISDVVSDFHTAHRPIILTNLEPVSVFLDQDNTAKLSNFNFFFPAGEENRRVAKCKNVYSFGVLFLSLLTGKSIDWITLEMEGVTKEYRKVCISEIVDPVLTKNGVATTELSAAIELALRCIEEETYRRPTMVDVANELYNMIDSSESFATTSSGV
ncbi:hypothetical protein BVRB_2g044960 [Beta vulgaris subsp. vulgaris]|uniref:non-specific serine/threonine protein kinase n=1 Tax=Beta vulgaris subsp. vulgaris TaxID=3555 RepID=A0A0J8BEL4_BETVV|nr:hypothetical protein BVRB_2g044960 [Beta vulgaris subsp. vulgaris]